MPIISGNVSRFLTFLCVAFWTMAVNPACAKEPDGKKTAVAPSTKQASAAQKAQPEAAANQSASPGASPQQTADAAQPQTAHSVEPPSASAEKKPDVKVDVYLFHGTYRCFSCNLMEELTTQAIDEQFAAEKKAGTVVFQHINIEESQNRHFIQDYRLAAISIILSQKSGGKEKQWKNLDQVWTLLRNDVQFKEYIVKEIKSYLKG